MSSIAFQSFLNTQSEVKGFVDQGELARHFTKHNSEFTPPFINEKEYEQAAINFINEQPGSDVYQGVRSNGDVIRFNELTNEFGVVRADGVIRTYFIPDPIQNGISNWEYILNQIW